MSEERKRKLRRIARYPICEVFEYIDASPPNGQQINFYGDTMHIRSSTLECMELCVRNAE